MGTGRILGRVRGTWGGSRKPGHFSAYGTGVSGRLPKRSIQLTIGESTLEARFLNLSIKIARRF